ncbi:Fatty acid-binding protein DegV [Petrocella atlantisensis]|uniref:Fatty acid-binding protein DegV n=1 Tax=Petrocella atlantisensis TaxID=2173034 RepID=A0A3P7PZT0_9FIRM|nr:DegV family protein [Petrocella atlantisensis]MCF8019188.1 DegV family EDD domain-containing protein [Vallitaleaceae bacterium]VDN48651.1 Fatty acid-binding protein DegV [Petrocella atlantisensis]
MNEISNMILYHAYRAGAHEVIRHRNQLNSINVFPVADGDTGSNLSSMMHSILNESKLEKDIGNTMRSIADAAIIGARGNSGIIFAQYLSGVSIGLEKGAGIISIRHYVEANKTAVDYAYDAVEMPTEGTMLTLIRVWSEALYRFMKKTTDFGELLSYAYGDIEEALIKTQYQLASLKKAAVVDAGAKGFVHFIDGFLQFLKGDHDTQIKYNSKDIVLELEPLVKVKHHENVDLTYRYCTEAMMTDLKRPLKEIKNDLHTFGNSLIVAGNERKMRVHIHTNQPADFFRELRNIGQITFQKVDDMVMQSSLVNESKYKVGLVTDSIADLPQTFIEKHQIQVINLNILHKEDIYIDRITIDNTTAIRLLEEGEERATSSQPDRQTVIFQLQNLQAYYDEIIVITVSKALSGTYNVFQKAATELENNPSKITVIDSKQNSAAQGLLVMECAKLIEQGVPYNKIIETMQTLVERSKILVSVKNLNAMIMSGRLSTKGGKIANLINLKPIVTLDPKGEGGLGGFAFSHEASLKKIKKKLIKINGTVGLKAYCVVHANNLEAAKAYAIELERVLEMAPVYLEDVSSIIAIGAGDGAIAVGYITH